MNNAILTAQFMGRPRWVKSNTYIKGGEEKAVHNFDLGGLRAASFGKSGDFLAGDLEKDSDAQYVVFLLGQYKQNEQGGFISWAIQGYRRVFGDAPAVEA